MFARVSTYSGGDIDRLVEGFERATSDLKQIPGQAGAYFCVDRKNGKALTITLWETNEALEDSVERARELRTQATDQAGATQDSVTHYEVPIVV
jgi:heme-degrading monooxygenase HmoA